MINEIEKAVSSIKRHKPLILSCTNYVTMDFMANSLLAVGAAPVMSIYDWELEELVRISSAININIGTLDDQFIKRCERLAMLGKKHKKPIILDPVGAGATLARTKIAQDLLCYVDIVRGNASEIMSLVNSKNKTFGVESVNTMEEAKKEACMLAEEHGITVVVSGERDFITDTSQNQIITFGSHLMPLITGMGCALTAIIAAFRAVVPDSFEASCLATSYFGLCGNLAEKITDKPGSFRTAFIDELYSGNFKEMSKFYAQ